MDARTCDLDTVAFHVLWLANTQLTTNRHCWTQPKIRKLTGVINRTLVIFLFFITGKLQNVLYPTCLKDSIGKFELLLKINHGCYTSKMEGEAPPPPIPPKQKHQQPPQKKRKNNALTTDKPRLCDYVDQMGNDYQ